MPRHASPLRHRLPALAVALLLAACAAGRSATPALSTIRQSDATTVAIAARVARTPGAEVRVAAWRLDGRGPRVEILSDSLVHAASTMKVPVMIALAREADAGRLRLDSVIVLGNQFASIVDGSPYSLSKDDDSDDSVYAQVGQQVTLRWLATHMITRSSNLATNMLLTVVRADSVTALTRRLGATRMLVRRGVEDNPAFRAGLNNVTTAHDLAVLLTAIATQQAASPAQGKWMMDVLFAQAYNDAIPAGLPAGTRVAHKTGSITRVQHDAAIVYPAVGAPYVLVVLTSGIESEAESKALIADVTRIVHGAMQQR